MKPKSPKLIALPAVALLAAMATPLAAQAAAFVELPTIDREVATFTGASIGQPGGATLPVDRRLRLARCISPLALSWHTPRRETVLVQCPDAGGWRLFVPVNAVAVAAAAAAEAPAVTRGEVVTISVAGDGFSVSQSGEALEPGGVGSWIRVRPASQGSTSKGEPIRAQVMRPGLVVIPMP